MTATPNTSLSFPEAIAFTQSLMEKISVGKLEETEIQEQVTSLVSTSNGARGFFVAYLTADSALADNPSSGVIQALQNSPNLVSELLVKNVAMSAAMAITHRRNEDETAATGSDRVNRRTINLIQQLNMDAVDRELEALKESVTSEEGSYQEFLKRWGYDDEQKQVINQAIAKCFAEDK
ncbi:MAG: hypothetical protein QNJ70_03695 [Xenococcaceae cyanobacterium MO_207.B15]|nr:hypothetical protein [Xenococcaceae cyanobacterium MO_207.B15]MDJ0742406.1 hypothetical protein [Xenococcaceae cyanobacterium MO_167.B27]